MTEDTIKWVRQESDKRSITAAPNTTKAGNLILSWYLDELPQLFNIAKGDMSFVGPRPHVLYQHKEEISLGLIYRDIIKAGLLGIPQVCKRRPKYAALLEDMAKAHKPVSRELNKLDALYANKCLTKTPIQILFFDAYLMFQGLIVVFRGAK